MATTNILQWNPSQANQESDSDYAADGQRIGGASSPSPFPAKLANKVFYQTSTFASAFAKMMVAKGYNISDVDINALAGVLANVYTTADNLQPALGFTPVQQGTGIGQHSNVVKMGWDGSQTKITIDSADQGGIAMKTDTSLLQAAINLINTPTAVNNVTSTRAFATTYQNTSGFKMVVQVTMQLTGGVGQSADMYGQLGSTGSVLDIVSNSITNDGGTADITIIVPPGWFYAVRTVARPAAPSLLFWIETIN